jgi:hypothetical protein
VARFHFSPPQSVDQQVPHDGRVPTLAGKDGLLQPIIRIRFRLQQPMCQSDEGAADNGCVFLLGRQDGLLQPIVDWRWIFMLHRTIAEEI